MRPLKNLRLVFLLILFVAVQTTARGQTWQKVSTLEDAYAKYPARIDSLLKSLDLNSSALEKVKEAYSRRDPVGACRALLDYYTTGNTASHLRRQQPSPSSHIETGADSILADIFTFYDVADVVPRKTNGQLDWSHDGPGNDIEWAWGLNRHNHLMILLESYFATGNAGYAQAIDDHIQDWVISSSPYPRVKSSTAMWRGLEVALRAKVWVRVFFALANSDHLSPATKILMLSSIPDHVHYMRNFHAKAGNWLTMEMSGLAMVATAWPEFKGSSDCVSYAKNNMVEGLREQVYPDGVQKELTSHYHQVALYNFEQFAEICKHANEPLPDAYKATLEKMHDYLARSVKPNGYGILNNDSDNRYNRELIEKAAAAYGREDWLFVASNASKGKRPAGSPSVMYPWAGQLIMRSGYDADAQWAFFDVGPWGTGHQHSDKLHISIAAHGRDLLVDGGRFAYRGELARKFRSYATGSASHNVVLIDGAGQSAGPLVTESALTTSSYKITDHFDYASGAVNDFIGIQNAAHNRAVLYMRDEFWVVVDRITTDVPRKIETLWHWHPQTRLNIQPDGITSTDHEKGNLNIIPVEYDAWDVNRVIAQVKPTQGWYSDRYNLAEPAPATIYSTNIEKTSTFVWILQPSEGRVKPLLASIRSQDSEKITITVRDESSNQWVIDVPFTNSGLAGYAFNFGHEQRIRDNAVDNLESAKILLSRLDLQRPGMERVGQSKSDPAAAVLELLSYYRSRTSVKHPVDRGEREKSRGSIADEADLRIADDALRHVFVGQSAYPSYYCGDDINWASRPVPDNEWVWQLNRMSFWDAMGRAYWHTGDEKYAREWGLQLVDWTQKNPRDDQHEYAWRSIEAGIRGYRWTGLFQRFIDSPSFTPEILVAFLNSCYDHATYLMTKYRQGSNWGLMEAEGMAFIAMTFPEFRDAAKWRAEAIARLNREIETQVYPDGHQRELAIGYHTGSVEWFKRTLDLATMNGLRSAFPRTYIQRIEKMCEVPFKLGFPDGTTAQFGDSWTGEPGKIWPMLKEWGELFDRDDFLYVASQGKEGKKPAATAYALEASGFYAMRSGWDRDAICMVLKCGPDGGGHCQPDNGTFELYAGGRHLMPDAGSYIYSSDREGRAWFRQTKVHQTLTLNGENSAYAPKLLLWKPGKDHDVLVVENESYPGLTHRRAVFFVDHRYFVIVDEAFGSAEGEVNVHFQFGPGPAIFDSARMTVRTDFKDGWNAVVQAVRQDGIGLSREEGWVSFVYTKKEVRPAFRYSLRKDSAEGVRFVTVVAPYDGIDPPEFRAAMVGSPDVGAEKLDLEVSEAGLKRNLGYRLPKR